MKKLFLFFLTILVTGCVNKVARYPNDVHLTTTAPVAESMRRIKPDSAFLVQPKSVSITLPSRPELVKKRFVDTTNQSSQVFLSKSSLSLKSPKLEIISQSVASGYPIDKPILSPKEKPHLVSTATTPKHTMILSQNTSEKSISIDRYTQLKPGVSAQEIDVMQQVVEISVPHSLNLTVRDGFNYALKHAGFGLCEKKEQVEKSLLNKPLPDAHRRLGPIPLGHILTILAGPAWNVTVDYLTRTVCFQVSR